MTDDERIAEERARDALAEQSATSGIELAILPRHTRRLDFGWAFIYNTATYALTGDPMDGVAGNGPLVVDLERNRVDFLGSALPSDQAVALYIARRALQLASRHFDRWAVQADLDAPERESILRALAARGREPVLFRAKDMLRRRVLLDRTTMVVGDVPTMRAAMQVLGVSVPAPDDYPHELQWCLERKIVKRELRWARDEAALGRRVFVKPASQLKRFTGLVLGEGVEVAGVGGHTECWCSEPVRWLSEYRYFVVAGVIVGRSHYRGGIDPVPDDQIVQRAVVHVSQRLPTCFAIDFGVLESGATALVERNEGYAIASYGLADEDYLRVLEGRWLELLQTLP